MYSVDSWPTQLFPSTERHDSPPDHYSTRLGPGHGPCVTESSVPSTVYHHFYSTTTTVSPGSDTKGRENHPILEEGFRRPQRRRKEEEDKNKRGTSE